MPIPEIAFSCSCSPSLPTAKAIGIVLVPTAKVSSRRTLISLRCIEVSEVTGRLRAHGIEIDGSRSRAYRGGYWKSRQPCCVESPAQGMNVFLTESAIRTSRDTGHGQPDWRTRPRWTTSEVLSTLDQVVQRSVDLLKLIDEGAFMLIFSVGVHTGCSCKSDGLD